MNEEPLGDARFQITWIARSDDPTALLTVRGKDHDVTAQNLRDIAAAALKVARAMESAP